METDCNRHASPTINPQARPDFFIVGAPKCGTTAMSAYLARHPEIFMARKEMHFFGSDLHFAANFYRRAKREYLAEFGGWNGQRRIGEASVWYLLSKTAAAEIKAFNPNSRIIVMLRDPVEVLHSLYHQFRSDGNENLSTFQSALANQDDRRAGRHIARRTYFRQGLIYDEVAGYTEQIRRYFEVFGRERVHVVIYDDFKAETEVAFARVLDFLEVDSTKIGNSFNIINENKSVKSRFLQAVMCDPLVRGTAIAMRSWLPRPAFNALQNLESLLATLNVSPAKRSRLDPDLDASSSVNSRRK